jgi:hypothetical protein
LLPEARSHHLCSCHRMPINSGERCFRGDEAERPVERPVPGNVSTHGQCDGIDLLQSCPPAGGAHQGASMTPATMVRTHHQLPEVRNPAHEIHALEPHWWIAGDEDQRCLAEVVLGFVIDERADSRFRTADQPQTRCCGARRTRRNGLLEWTFQKSRRSLTGFFPCSPSDPPAAAVCPGAERSLRPDTSSARILG